MIVAIYFGPVSLLDYTNTVYNSIQDRHASAAFNPGFYLRPKTCEPSSHKEPLFENLTSYPTTNI